MIKKIKFSLAHQKLRDDKGNPVSEIQLFKLGNFEHWSGESFKVDSDFISEMISNFESMKSKSKDDHFLPMDYNHGSLSYGAEDAKAAGWILDLAEKEDGLYATVEWTDEAAVYIKNGEYRYISPEFSIDVTDEYGEEIEGAVLYAAALTNRPFLKGMAPVTLSAKQKEKKEDHSMDLKQIGKALGLSGEYSEKEILAALEKRQASFSEACEALGLKDGEELSGGIKRLLAEREKSSSEMKELRDEVLALSAEQKSIKATTKVEKLLTEKKLVPAQRDNMIKLAIKDPELFEQVTKDLPVNVALSAPVGSGGEGSPEGGETFEKAIEARLREKPSLSYLAAMKEIQKENPALAAKHASSRGLKITH